MLDVMDKTQNQRLLGPDRNTISSETGLSRKWPGQGNFDADPLFAWRGYWADPDHPESNLDPSDNRAVWIEGDYHLQSQAERWDPQAQAWVQDEVTSPCVDAGDPLDPVSRKLSGSGDPIALGAYGG